jgi:hypothetical protein
LSVEEVSALAPRANLGAADAPVDRNPAPVYRCFWTAQADAPLIHVSLAPLRLTLLVEEDSEANCFLYYAEQLRLPNLFFVLPWSTAKKIGARFKEKEVTETDVALAYVSVNNVMYFTHTQSGNRGLGKALREWYQEFFASKVHQWPGRPATLPKRHMVTVSRKPCPVEGTMTSCPLSEYNDCRACGLVTPDLLVCSRCRKVHYCSPKCQKDDWRLHKKHCHA